MGKPRCFLCCPKGDFQSVCVCVCTDVCVHPTLSLSLHFPSCKGLHLHTQDLCLGRDLPAHLSTVPRVMGTLQDKSWIRWGNRFPERKDTGGGSKLQLNGATTPPPLHHRLARCVFSIPGSWGQLLTHTGHLLCGLRDALRSPLDKPHSSLWGL